MGRRIPTDVNFLIHPALSFSLLALGIAATIAMITALCGVRSRKKPTSTSSSSFINKTAEKSDVFNSTATKMTVTSPSLSSPPKGAEQVDSEDTSHNKEPQIKELPLPPAKQMRESHSCNQISKSPHERRLSMSLSMKLPRSLSMARKEENHRRKKGNLNSEDTVWMKTIILGEKCKVPDEDDAVIHDGKGNRISTYHPKNPSMLSLSRQCSFKDPDTS
ncbi:putative transmembrane protein [Fagus crenata]|jgi:hypothetical protein